MKLPAVLSTRKAAMTLVCLGAVLLVVGLVPFSAAVAGNLPTILGAIVGVLTVYLTGHAIDQKWTIGQTLASSRTTAAKPEDEEVGC